MNNFFCNVKLSPNECPVYDIQQSDGEDPVMPELWGMRSTISLISIPGPLWPGEVAPDSVLSMNKKGSFDTYTNCKQMTYAELNCLK